MNKLARSTVSWGEVAGNLDLTLEEVENLIYMGSIQAERTWNNRWRIFEDSVDALVDRHDGEEWDTILS